jgi:hypothetical protein
MLTVFAFMLLLDTSPTASTTPFAERVARGKAMEKNADGPAYQKLLWQDITTTMTVALRGCLTSNAPADKSPFTLVSDVGPDGRTLHVDVKPATPVATCLAGQFATWRLPIPPKLSNATAYPIEIDVTM